MGTFGDFEIEYTGEQRLTAEGASPITCLVDATEP